MNTLFVITTLWDSAYYTLGNFFAEKKADLEDTGLIYSPEFGTEWHLYNHEYIPVYINWILNLEKTNSSAQCIQNARLALNSKIKILDEQARDNNNVLLFYGTPCAKTLPVFLEYIEKSSNLKNYSIKPIIILNRQDHEVLSYCHRMGKGADPQHFINNVVTEHMHNKLSAAYNFFAKQCTPENCTVLVHQPPSLHKMDIGLFTPLFEALDLPHSLYKSFAPQDQFPYSGAALDMTWLLKEFPFLGHTKWDKHFFHKTLLRVEREEGYPIGNYFSQQLSFDTMGICNNDNTVLANKLQNPQLFCVPSPFDSLPDASDKCTASTESHGLPNLTHDQARAFVSAFGEDWRKAFLRHLRQLPPPYKHGTDILGSCLENYCKPAPRYGWQRKTPLLSVLTLAHDHQNFIVSCMESVQNQNRNFTMDHIIVDDCSNDETASIIDNFASANPHVWPIYLTERNSDGQSVQALFSKCRSKYAALCDGDDYFTDPCKLQTQVNFMEAHPDCALCFHPVKMVYEGGTAPERTYPSVEQLPRGIKPFYYLSDLFRINFIQTNSALYRWRFRDGLPSWFRPDCCPGDWYWHLLHAELGKIGFINTIMSVYRRHEKGMYYLSEIDRLKHRATVGMKEIEVYDIINQHFEKRYESILLRLINGVFADCLMYDKQRADKDGVEQMLPKLVDQYPHFARHFLNSLKAVSSPTGLPSQ